MPLSVGGLGRVSVVMGILRFLMVVDGMVT
jgi:hypothetical protein